MKKVTSQTIISHVQFVTGVLLILVYHIIVKQFFLLKQLYKIWPLVTKTWKEK